MGRIKFYKVFNNIGVLGNFEIISIIKDFFLIILFSKSPWKRPPVLTMGWVIGYLNGPPKLQKCWAKVFAMFSKDVISELLRWAHVLTCWYLQSHCRLYCRVYPKTKNVEWEFDNLSRVVLKHNLAPTKILKQSEQ